MHPPSFSVYGSTDIFLQPTGPCVHHQIRTNISKDFVVKECVEQHPGDEQAFFKVKFFNGNNLIYCPEQSITINGKTEPCPQFEVIMLPSNVDFTVGTRSYHGSFFRVEHYQEADPMMSFHANWHLQPQLHIKQIMAEIQSAEDHLRNASSHTVRVIKSHHPVMIINTGIIAMLLVSILITLTIFIRRHLRKRRERTMSKTSSVRMRVKAKRIRFRPMTEIIEEDVQETDVDANEN